MTADGIPRTFPVPYPNRSAAGRTLRPEAAMSYSIARLARTCCIVSFLALFLVGCPAPDYGEGEACICGGDQFLLSFMPPCGPGITAIEKRTPTVLTWGFPGKIVPWEVEGGDDADWVFNTVVPPLDGCDGGCLPSEDCLNAYGVADRVCATSISNRNTPYFWAVSGYAKGCYPDVGSPQGLCEICYVELKSGYIDAQEWYTVEVVRAGASVDEETGPNYAYGTWDSSVVPPPVFTLSPVRHPEAADLALQGPANEASIILRENDSEDPDADEGNLKKRYIDSKDNSVDAEYRVTTTVTNPDAPIVYDNTVRADRDKWNSLKAAGYDILVANRLYNAEYPPSGPGVSGMADCPGHCLALGTYAQYDTRRTLTHEMGHCLGLYDNEVQEDYNIMINFGSKRGMDVSFQCNQRLLYCGGRPEWQD